MLGNWNDALRLLDSGLNQSDVATTPVPYGEELEGGMPPRSRRRIFLPGCRVDAIAGSVGGTRGQGRARQEDHDRCKSSFRSATVAALVTATSS